MYISFNYLQVSNLEKMKLTQMTSVQQLAIPHIMMESDILVKSQTGSGKIYLDST